MIQKKKKFGRISEKIKGLCFVLSVTGRNRANTGNDDVDDDNRDDYDDDEETLDA
jgi:hypothetical protein